MGKYMKKSKPTGEVAIMEVSDSQPSFGVRTQAKTLALQRSSAQPVTSAFYLQLQSRRLEKPPILMTKRLEPKSRRRTMRASTISSTAAATWLRGSLVGVSFPPSSSLTTPPPLEKALEDLELVRQL
ncbi:hypothetical protein ACFX12_035494 [Malus domestica]